MTAPARRMLVRHLMERRLTERRALAVVRMSASALRYVPRPDRNVELRERILALAQRHKRYGVGMIYLKLRQEQWPVNYKRVERLYQQARLQVRRRKRKKVLLGQRQPLLRPEAANQVWSMDFVFDRTAEGRVLKALTIVDDATHEAVAIEVERAISGHGVVRVLDRLALTRDLPQVIRTDNVLTVESSLDLRAQANEAVSDVLCTRHPLLSKCARELPRSRRSPDLNIMNTRSSERPRPYLKQHGVPWKARTLSTGS
ncbi:putative is1404 transposase orf b (fragment) protein [Xanthomonas albilineans GPE PC73]|uniref:Putative is1404 transposase orf b protein n=1 Tax=Xanthomonas albilineans (strain GPE PC73 / CFBP 7063) TaxID=380358 RepID=D2UE13_XANAP